MPKLISLSADLKEAFQHLILQRTGLVIRPSDRDSFAKKISMRMDAVNFISPQDYYLLLESRTQESKEEWQNLVALLTNNESYFFRDKEQIHLLQNHILPKIIQKKQIEKTIRICSAGCSTGEEPYSLAIMLQELIPNYKQWQLSVFGIDINQIAINSARKAIYSPWSFRGVSEVIKGQYFQQVNQQYQLEPRIKNMVQFHLVNLVQDEFPFNDIDLFICRNVFIYFNAPAITKVVNKIYHALNPDGYLLTGHAELSGQNLSQFHRLSFSQSLIYQRRKEGEKQQEIRQPLTVKELTIPQFKPIKPAKTLPKPITVKTDPVPVKKQPIISPSPIKKEPVKPTVNKLLETAKNFIEQERYQAALEQFQQILDINSNHTDAAYWIAQIYANQGRYQDAILYCERLLKIDSLAIAPHYLLARIAEETGKLEEAKYLLKKIIYLDPNSVAAYLDLTHIYTQEGDERRAIKMYQESLNILQMLPPETPIVERGNLTASQLLLQLS
ncbi:CheR family methyltransferase [Crocosphaera chwakensis]|uniref:protein-glutamate O-methyltransferase n=1 Tax=Crocosphaera chwakensis CCY0110 TaxID=391612 RepID=A3IYB9_9CHRO|nr:CheR family methyltransferase [Crocosphaera chwakensis]EAZ88527.1 MCP methyltransferase, CheR-type [Crocosphaera chwakensis CCY0110]